jgi:glucokinase
MKEIFKRASLESSDSLNQSAKKIFEEWVHALAVGLANSIVIFNPSVIILTGGITKAWTQIQPRLDNVLKPMVESHLLNSTLIEISKLGQYFGVHGAIALAAENTTK